MMVTTIIVMTTWRAKRKRGDARYVAASHAGLPLLCIARLYNWPLSGPWHHAQHLRLMLLHLDRDSPCGP